MDNPSGPAGRRARWHETLSKFDLTIQYVPGKDNVVADAMSRYAYPACKAFQDASFHGSAQAQTEMKRIIEEELREGRTVGLLCFTKHTGASQNMCLVAGSITRVEDIPAGRIMVIGQDGTPSGLPPKRPRGRPRKHPLPADPPPALEESDSDDDIVELTQPPLPVLPTPEPSAPVQTGSEDPSHIHVAAPPTGSDEASSSSSLASPTQPSMGPPKPTQPIGSNGGPAAPVPLPSGAAEPDRGILERD